MMSRLANGHVPRGLRTPNGTMAIMVSASRPSEAPRYNAGAFEAAKPSTPASDRSAARTDIALLVSTLFLPRFTLAYGHTFLQLDLLSFGLILLYQFFNGKIIIQYDRFLWFIGLGMAATFSLLLNFNSGLLTGYAMFTCFYFLFVFSRSSTRDQYRRTLHAFQFLVALLSAIGVVQFAAQFVVDGSKLYNFYGIIPDFLFSDYAVGMHDPRLSTNGGKFIQATGLFLPEPSALGQMTALGILIESLEFRRRRYLLVMAVGFLLAYSGTGLMLLFLFLPLAGLRRKETTMSALFVVILIVGLVVTGIIDLSTFSSRVDEFEKPGSSAFLRFVLPFWEAAKDFESGNLQALLLGHGPGTLKTTYKASWYGETDANWLKMLYEYGLIGSFIFYCFLGSCVRGSRCPGVVIAAIIFTYLFLQSNLLLAIPLFALNGTEFRRGHLPGSAPKS